VPIVTDLFAVGGREDSNLGPIATCEFGGIRFDLAAAVPAPHDQANAGRGRGVECHRWSGLGFPCGAASWLSLSAAHRPSAAARACGPAPV